MVASIGVWPLTPFCLETCKSARPKMEKNGEEETKRTYTEGDAAGQLGPGRRESTFITMGTLKAVREELYLTKGGGNVATGQRFFIKLSCKFNARF